MMMLMSSALAGEKASMMQLYERTTTAGGSGGELSKLQTGVFAPLGLSPSFGAIPFTRTATDSKVDCRVHQQLLQLIAA
jgi:hypothetical protein